MNLIKLEKVNKSFGIGRAKTTVLRNINISIKSGEFVAIVGQSGSGKTTLMNIIGLLDKPTSGHYLLNQEDVMPFRDRDLAIIRRLTIGFVFQNFNLLGRMSVRSNVMLPMVYSRINREQRRERAERLLRLVGLGDRADFLPNQLSGGQMQRVAIARALANKPSLVLADEPTGNLDSRTGATVMRILKRLHQRGNTVIVVTHNATVARLATRIIRLKDGRIVGGKV